MKFTSLLLWTQENKVSEKFYKKLGFEVVSSDDASSIVRLHDFEITLVNMRGEEPFTRDAIALQKGRGMYIYLAVNDMDKTYGQLQKNRHPAAHRAQKLGMGQPRIHRQGPGRIQTVLLAKDGLMAGTKVPPLLGPAKCGRLLEAAGKALVNTYPESNKGYAVALLTSKDNIYRGISYLSKTQTLTMHAEATALANAAIHGEKAIVAITGPNCHICKQLIYESSLNSGIDTLVIIQEPAGIRQVPISQLMLYPWPE